ncbi:MAG: hypothetical protein JXN60_05965, partial [Lentisphaerae bacterium]|nr:hypothetical protein [Lentisphaerota bacterium]
EEISEQAKRVVSAEEIPVSGDGAEPDAVIYNETEEKIPDIIPVVVVTTTTTTTTTSTTTTIPTPVGPWTLTIRSSAPSIGVPIGVTPDDNGGHGTALTPFPMPYIYNDGTVVHLTAAPVAAGNTFQRWHRNDGWFTTNQIAIVLMTTNYTMTAYYVYIPGPIPDPDPSPGGI